MVRQFRVVTTFDKDSPEVITAFGVTDMSDKEFDREQRLKSKRNGSDIFKYKNQEEVRPRLATFEVSGLYGQEEQEERAWELCRFMNKMQDSINEAVSQHSLMDVLTAGAAGYSKADPIEDKDEN